MLRTLASTLILTILTGPPAAAEEPLVTDRPDVAESAVTVGSGRVQLETGVLFQRFRDGSADQVVTPTLLRVGTGPDTELRLESDGLTFQGPDRGVSDVALGFKLNLSDSDGVATGLLFDVLLPTGSRAFRGASAEPAARFLLDADLSEEWGLGFNAGVILPEDPAGNRFLQGAFALSLGRSLSEEVRVYGEVFGAGPDAAPGGPVLLGADTGITWLLNPDLQLDASFLRGLSSGGLDWGVSAGVSARF